MSFYLLTKDALFFVFHPNIELKTRKHEFVDSSHQNKQIFYGKKLSGLSGKEFIAFEECVWQTSSANCTQRLS